ncbi:DUF4054 domain-containing protein [Providencia hangzhouensis]
MFPDFSNIADELLPYLFDQATDYLDNTEFSLVIQADKRERLLYLLMAHLAYMRYGDKDGKGGSGMVGRVSSASEGSVSVSSELGSIEFRNAWYTLSPYGMDYWQATKVYRMANYYPGSIYG